MSGNTDESESSSMRFRFSGKREDWKIFKDKFESYLAMKNVLDILDVLDTPNVIPTDKDPTIIESRRRLRTQNRQAMGFLIAAIDTTELEGISVHQLVTSTKDEEGGYRFGNFATAWESLNQQFQPKKVVKDKDTLLEEYYGLKLKDRDDPMQFFVTLKDLRNELKQAGHKFTDEEMTASILNKLPKLTDDGSLSPWQTKKEIFSMKLDGIIKPKEGGGPYGLSALEADIHEFYREREAILGADSNIAGDERALAAHGKQFKGKCSHCGKIGHKAIDCYSRKRNGNGNGNGNDSGKTRWRFGGKCNHCGIRGHKASECRKKAARDRGDDTAAVAEEVMMTCMEVTPIIDEESGDGAYGLDDDFFDYFSDSGPEEDEENDRLFPEWMEESYVTKLNLSTGIEGNVKDNSHGWTSYNPFEALEDQESLDGEEEGEDTSPEEDPEVANSDGSELCSEPPIGTEENRRHWESAIATELAKIRDDSDVALVAKATGGAAGPKRAVENFNSDTWMADSGASTHMGNCARGLKNVREIEQQVKIGDGKSLQATKMGNYHATIRQVDGTELEVVLSDYKYVPQLFTGLISITKCLSQGWNIGNEGIHMSLKKGNKSIRFDRKYKTGDGFLCGVEVIPKEGDDTESAAPAMSKTRSLNINDAHCRLNHSNEDCVRRTLKKWGVTVTHKWQQCADCKVSNAIQKAVPKSTGTRATKQGDRVFLDISSIKHPSMGGKTFWLLMVDDYTRFRWSSFLTRKSETADVVVKWLHKMKANSTPVKYIRCDNAGENRAIFAQAARENLNVTAEYTARETPQQNGRAERMFAVLWDRVRALLTAAKIEQPLRNKLWAEAARHATDVENVLVHKGDTHSSYERFYGGADPPKWIQFLRKFGELGIVKTKPKVVSKLTNRGTEMVYVGRAVNHSADTYRMWNRVTNKIIVTRDVTWLNRVLGGNSTEDAASGSTSSQPGLTVNTPNVPNADARNDQVEEEEIEFIYPDDEVADNDQEEIVPEPAAVTHTQAPPTTLRPTTRSQGLQPVPALTATTPKVVREMRKLTWSDNPIADTIVERIQTVNQEEKNVEAANISLLQRFTMSEKFGMDDVWNGDFAMAAAGGMSGNLDVNGNDPALYRDIYQVPGSFQEAYNHPDPFQRNLWREAIKKEFSRMTRRGVWRKVKRSSMPQGKRCVKHKWVLEIKRSGTFRARLVACGYSQVPGEDFNEIYSPVVNDVTFRILVVLMLTWRKKGVLFDIETAFLYGDLEEEIYMECPEGLEHEDDEVVELLQTIYGLVQSARMFFLKLKSVLVDKLNFLPSEVDPCLFSRDDEDGLVIVIIYVDDGLAIGDTKAIEKMLKQLETVGGFTCTVDYGISDYLSCDLKFNQEGTKAWIGQPHMVKKIQKEFGTKTEKLKSVLSPGTPGLHLVRPKSKEECVTPDLQKEFQSGTGMLLYLVKHSRPDLANPVRELTKCMKEATPAAYKEMLRVIKYVLDTKDLGLRMFPKIPEDGKIWWNLVMYSDSDWAGDKDDRKSIGGYVMFLNEAPIMWRSKSQTTVAMSSSEAEFYACGEAVKEVLFVTQLLLSLGIAVELPVVVQVDNLGAIYMVENQSTGHRTRHMDTRWHFVRQYHAEGLIKVVFVRSEENKSDPMTKNVTTELNAKHGESYMVDASEIMKERRADLKDTG